MLVLGPNFDYEEELSSHRIGLIIDFITMLWSDLGSYHHHHYYRCFNFDLKFYPELLSQVPCCCDGFIIFIIILTTSASSFNLNRFHHHPLHHLN